MNDKMNRLLKRALLYGALILIAVGAFWLHKSQENAPVFEDWRTFPEREEVKNFQEYLQIDTAWPKSNTGKAVAFWTRLFDDLGVESRVLKVGPERYNFVATIPGGDHPPLILHHHMDVSPILEPEKWKHPPFSGAIEGPYIWGRGALDMKNYGIIYYYAIKRALDEQWVLKRPIVFLATPTEEREMTLGTPWIMENHPELIPRGSTFITEGGAFELVTDKLKYCGILTCQKEWVFYDLPEAEEKNLLDLHKNISPLFPKEVVLLPGVASILKRLAPHRIAYRDILEEVDTLFSTDRDRLLKLPDPYLSLMRREYHIVQPEMGKSGYRLILSLLPGDNPEVYRRNVEKALIQLGVEFQVTFESPQLEITATDTDDFRGIEEAVREIYPYIDTGPYATPWKMNEGQYLRREGYLSYGIIFSPINIFDMTHAGAADERMHLSSFMKGLDLGAAILKNLAIDKN